MRLSQNDDNHMSEASRPQIYFLRYIFLTIRMPSNQPADSFGDYCAKIQDEINNRLPLAGGNMFGNIDLGGNNIVNIGRLRGSNHFSRVDDLVTSSSASAGNLNIAIFDSTSGRVIKDSGVQISAVAGFLPLTGGTMVGSINLNGNSLTAIGIISGSINSRAADNIVSNSGSATSGNVATFSGGSGKIITDSSIISTNLVTNSGSSTVGRVAIFSSGSGKIIQDGGVLLSNLLTVSSAASTYLALSGGNMTGPIDSTGNLDLGINSSTSVNIGRPGCVTYIPGYLVSPLPKAAWYSLAGMSPDFAANKFRDISLLVDNSQDLVDFKLNNDNGNLIYTGDRRRTFVFTCNLNISFTASSTLSITVNKNEITGFVNGITGLFWDASIIGSRRLPFHLSDQINLSPGDTLILVGRWGNTSATQVTFGRCSFQIHALPN